MRTILQYMPGVLLFAFWGCNLEKEIEIKLPETEERYVVECYLQPGLPFNLLLSRTSGYFDPIPEDNLEFLDQLLVDGAEVRIKSANKVFTLQNQLAFNPITKKLFNYFSPELVPAGTGQVYDLEIITRDGEVLTATTRIMPVVKIDSVVIEFDDTDTLARVLTYFTDIPDEHNYYRRMIQHSSLDTVPDQDFTADDRFVERTIVFGTSYDYGRGDTIINTIFHIEKAYFEFLESVQFAVSSNGNPFAQPSPIISNIQGPRVMGIFTGLSYDRVISIVPD